VRRREGSRSSGHGHDGTTRILQPLLLMILLAPFARNCHKQRLVVLQLPVATVPGHHLSYEMFPYHLSQPHLPACPVPLSMAGVFTWRTMDMKWDSSSSLNEVELKVQARIFNSASPSLFRLCNQTPGKVPIGLLVTCIHRAHRYNTYGKVYESVGVTRQALNVYMPFRPSSDTSSNMVN